MRATRAIIHLERLKANLAEIRKKIGPKTAICIPVKADAYGHGAVRIGIAAIKAGAKFLAVASVQEGIELREAGIVAPILLFSLPIPEELEDVVRYHITPLVPDTEFAHLVGKTAERLGEILPVHIKIDTGMGRIGCRPENILDLVEVITSYPSLHWEGTATHLSVADSLDTDDRAYTQKQLQRFSDAVDALCQHGYKPGILHAANSGAVVLHENSYFDMVRPGLLAYGYPPIPELAKTVPVQPVMELQTHVVFMKKVYPGEAISYGRKWQASQETVIGTLPIGYADGLPRRLSGKLSLSIGGRRYPLVGRICMDQCMIDLGMDSPVRRWEPVTVFGGTEADPTAAELSELLGTIPYEITCGINKRVPRVYVE
ncbi:alanine racemase [Gracilinema caldarium]|uniref:Alanine racemase n=1 Tax=Gracilinema caldarium (strain ATCC 51460 / DSM 7334 / H1) TaxID=744872 RepID=F8F4F7_GRAC1|nr:alanine racemase [Gracilinema caldarium]AEJ20604.1 Alanine racemase [Gracilinema caldarium DSM 7334]